MGGLFKPWRIVGVSITESELSDSISNILHHFMVAHSQTRLHAAVDLCFKFMDSFMDIRVKDT